MIYSNFQGLKLSRLGFGTMRLPTCADGSIDEEKTAQMLRYALEHGVNYFDTAYPYHGGKSETVIGRLLSAYPRDSYYLATKYPGHQTASTYDPAGIFEEQLRKCRVDYFDFYLLHNVCESSLPVYEDPQWGIIDYFLEQKRLGRIRHLGFSSHAQTETLRYFLDKYGRHMEFCQIQLNYLDWTLQDAKGKYDLLTERGIPVWVMEPLRGGKLAKLLDAAAALRQTEPTATDCDFAFRWLQGLENAAVILSGMSSPKQLHENIATFAEPIRPLSAQQERLLLETAEALKNSLPCTACRYCVDGCPVGLDIPLLIATYNDLRFQPSFTVSMRLEQLPPEQQPAACLACGACAQICPQKIDIPKAMRDLAEGYDKMPKWSEICREREAAAKANRNA